MTGRGHVTPGDVIDLVDGCASERARTHVETCAACRDQLALLTASLALTRTDRVPEPSPLFWDHFSARVSDAIREEPDVLPRWRISTLVRWWLIPGVAVLAVAFVVTVVPLRQSSAGRSDSPEVAGLPAAVVSARPEDGAAPTEVDGSWELVAALTAELGEAGEELAGLDPVPGSADRAVEQLSGDEQGELARLLEAELTRRPG